MRLFGAALLWAVGPLGALAALNCTVKAPVNLHCCPSSTSEIVATYQAGTVAMLGCVTDSTAGV